VTKPSGKRRPMSPVEQRAALAALVQRHSKLEPDEVELLRAVFPAIVEANYARLWSQIMRRVRDPAAAKDMLQEVAFLAFRRISEVGFTDSIPDQLRRIALGEILNYVRDRKRAPISVCLPSSGSAPPCTGPSPDSVLDLKAVADKLLPQLSDDHAEVVGLVILDELSHTEAAAALDIPVATLRTRLQVAKKELLLLAMELLPPSQWPKP
jgi:RNA polymerase sigma-70 factor (ECF subfamily)